MGKFKKMLAGIITGASALACVAMVGTKINAATITTEYTATLTGTGAFVAKDSEGNNGPTFTANGAKSLSVSGTSIITGNPKTYTTGVKLNSSGYVDFTADGDWELTCLVYNTSSVETYISLYDSTATTELAQSSNVAVKTVAPVTFSGKKGSYRIKRNEVAQKEFTALEVKISITKEVGTYYDVTFYDGETKISTTSVLENATIDASVVPSPKKFFNKLVGWKTSDGQSVDFSSFVVTENVNLYADFELDEIENENVNDLTPAYITKAATQISSIPSEGLVFTNTNYTILGTSSVMAETTKLPDAVKDEDKTPVTNFLQLNGKVTSSQCAIKVVLPEAGTLTVYARSGTSSANSFVLSDTSAKALDTKEFSSSEITKVTLTVEKAGTYLIGGNGGTTRVYASYFEAAPAVEVAKLNAQFDNDATKTEVRFIGTIVAEDLSKVTDIKIALTLSGFETPAVVEFTTVYTEITDLSGFGVAENTYYVVLVIDGLDAFRTNTLTGTLSFKIAGVEYSASLASALSLAVASAE
ncbi:MAG: hypothetical protein ACI35W_01140 [Anaeroplasmataceae bacterium]